MGLISQFKELFSSTPQHESSIDIYAPMSGKIVEIEKVPDVVFSEKIVGDGLAIEPTGNTIYAPIDGTIGKVFETNHAFSIVSNDGIELFVHFGIGTVELQGTGFSRLVEPDSQVKAGDPILTYNLDYISEHVTSLVSPVIVANMENIQNLSKKRGSVKAKQDILFSITC